MKPTWTADDGTTFETQQAYLDHENGIRPKKRLVSVYKGTTAHDPLKLAEIKTRREAGESLAEIGRVFGITRERVRQICQKHGIQAPEKQSKDEPITAAVELMRTTGKSREAACKEVGISSDTLRRGAKTLGIDLKAIATEGKTHRYDGRTFDWWTVVEGTYQYVTGEANKRSVECICKCGVRRRVNLGNLLNGASRGCGCRSTKKSEGRKRTPWVCDESGERFETTAALARHLGVNGICLHRKLHRGEPFSRDGKTWRALVDDAKKHTLGKEHREPWIELATGRIFPSGSAVAREVGVHVWHAEEPNSPRSGVLLPFRSILHPSRPSKTCLGARSAPAQVGELASHWKCEETGEEWETTKALAEHLGVQ